MCDEIAGTMRYADLKLDLPASMFSQSLKRAEPAAGTQKRSIEILQQNSTKTLNLLNRVNKRRNSANITSPDAYEDLEISDDEFRAVGEF
ncbi:hypothetical protein L228DRAFT_243663 [Xylona heveae TC161]|uniref:Uncharacterized protein n=1 Tax=Xylona heveae (strain CBS 132557 / TC161) TaxID=1328760 RepID=A0A161TFS0_XYLHT|nr:hypothetical protein L228DRAFT_243663 [Xylona heveae TC161]KZF24917.1 hypothetical protein L228DRAFT_243663 [Xylona heveae TC161]